MPEKLASIDFSDVLSKMLKGSDFCLAKYDHGIENL
jgi:hypothetical protein